MADYIENINYNEEYIDAKIEVEDARLILNMISMCFKWGLKVLELFDILCKDSENEKCHVLFPKLYHRIA